MNANTDVAVALTAVLSLGLLASLWRATRPTRQRLLNGLLGRPEGRAFPDPVPLDADWLMERLIDKLERDAHHCFAREASGDVEVTIRWLGELPVKHAWGNYLVEVKVGEHSSFAITAPNAESMRTRTLIELRAIAEARTEMVAK